MFNLLLYLYSITYLVDHFRQLSQLRFPFDIKRNTKRKIFEITTEPSEKVTEKAAISTVFYTQAVILDL